MASELTRYESEDLFAKRRELDTLNEQLAEREMELATWQAKLSRFERTDRPLRKAVF